MSEEKISEEEYQRRMKELNELGEALGKFQAFLDAADETTDLKNAPELKEFEEYLRRARETKI